MGAAVAFDVLHDEVGAVLLGGVRDLIIGEVGSVLENIVPSPGVDLAEVVVGALREGQLFGGLDHPHLHEIVVDHLESRLGKNALHVLELRCRRRLVESDSLVSVSSFFDSLQLKGDEIHGRSRHHLALIGIASFGVRVVVVIVSVGEPPASDEGLVEAGIEPVDGELVRGDEAGEGTLGGGVEESGEIDDVPTVGDEGAAESFLSQFLLEPLHRRLVPFAGQAIVGRRARVDGRSPRASSRNLRRGPTASRRWRRCPRSWLAGRPRMRHRRGPRRLPASRNLFVSA